MWAVQQPGEISEHQRFASRVLPLGVFRRFANMRPWGHCTGGGIEEPSVVTVHAASGVTPKSSERSMMTAHMTASDTSGSGGFCVMISWNASRGLTGRVLGCAARKVLVMYPDLQCVRRGMNAHVRGYACGQMCQTRSAMPGLRLARRGRQTASPRRPRGCARRLRCPRVPSLRTRRR